MRPLAIAHEKRLASLPDVPTFEELGIKGMEISNWFGIVAPKGTPKAIVDKLNEAVSKIASQPDVKQQWGKQGATPMSMTIEQFDKFLREDIAKWAPVVKATGMKVE
jgi:tripartite-type tricarboxylate transporter receptor subunit TctC